MDLHQLCYQLPYVKEFDARVTGCVQSKKGYEVTLDRTAFYPEGGGQLGDGGTIGDVKVSDTRSRNGQVVHYADAPLEPGTEVHCRIDWQKRLDHMQGHSGEHIVSGLVHKHWGYDNVGFHMAADKVTVDFDGIITEEELADLEREANEYVRSDVPVEISFPSAAELHEMEYRSKKELSGEVRIVTFPGVDVCACCGTHVQRSGEVGTIKFTAMSHYKSGVRIEMVCGRLATEDYAMKNAQHIQLCRLFSAKPHLLVNAVHQYMEAAEAGEHRVDQLAKRCLEFRAAQFPAGGRLIVDFEEDFTMPQLRQYCDGLVVSGKAQVAAVLSPSDKGGWNYVLRSDTVDLRAAIKDLNKRLGGRGGGDPTQVQGGFRAEKEEVESVLREFFK